MSIYVGTTTTDLNYLMNGSSTVSASVYVGNDHVWPLYEFSFYDGIMQKTVDNIAAAGATKSYSLRTCEDSWWHKLKFDIEYTFLSSRSTNPAVGEWLNRFAEDFIVNKTTHWLETTVSEGSISPANSLTLQSVSFDDHYSSFDGGTCEQASDDTQITCKIYPNQWFLPREGKLHCVQYNEWGVKSGGQVAHAEIATPSDNYPTIFFTQVANEWGENTQTVEFSATPTTTGAQGGTVNLKWKIYSNSTSGYTIYYGDDIASNNTSKDGPEEYAVGKMWITINGSSALKFNNDAKYNATTKEWTATATWADNSALGANASHSISFNGLQDVGTEGATFDVSATCTQVSQPRNATITLNVGDKNNWRPASKSIALTEQGETRQIPCYVSLNNDFSDQKYSVTVEIDEIPEPVKSYSLSKADTSLTSVGPDEGTFDVISYYTTESAAGAAVTVYAKCTDYGNTASVTITQSSLAASKVAVSVTADCVDGTETVTAGETNSTTYRATISYGVHSTPGEYDDEIVVTQAESGYTVSVVHVAKADVKRSYSYKIIVASSSSATTSTSSITIGKAETSATLYGRLFESCYCTSDGVKVPEGENAPDGKLGSYDYRPLSWVNDATPSGVGLADASFSLSGGTAVGNVTCWSLTKDTPENDATAVTLSLSGTANNDKSTEKIKSAIVLTKVSDTATTIGNSIGATATFEVTAHRNILEGGYTRTGYVSGSYSSAYASTSFSQASSVQTTDTGQDETVPGLTLTCTPNKSDFSASSTETNTAGRYKITIKCDKIWEASTSSSSFTYTGVSLEYDTPSTGKHTVVAANVGDSVTLKVKATGKKRYTGDASGSGTRSVNCSVSASGSNTVTCSNKTQSISPVTGTDTVVIPNASVSWSQSTNDSLAGSLSDKTDTNTSGIASAKLPINAEKSGAENDIQGTVTAKLTSYDVSKTFTITWLAGGYTPPVSTAWTLTVTYSVTNTTGSNKSVKMYCTINGTENSDLTPGEVKDIGSSGASKTKSINYSTAPGTQLTVIAYIVDTNDSTKSASKSITIAATNTEDKSVPVQLSYSTTTYNVEGSWDNGSTICGKGSKTYTFTATKNGSANNDVSGVTISNTDLFSIKVSEPTDGKYTVTVTGKSDAESHGGKSATLSIPKGDGTSVTTTVSKSDCYSIRFTTTDPSINIATTDSITLKYAIYENGSALSSKPSHFTVTCDDANDVKTYGEVVIPKSKFSVPKTTISISGSTTASHCSSCSTFSDSVDVDVSNATTPVPHAEFNVSSTSACHNGEVTVTYAYYSDEGASPSQMGSATSIKYKVGSTEYSMTWNSSSKTYSAKHVITAASTKFEFVTGQSGVTTPKTTSHTVTRTDTYTFTKNEYAITECACADSISFTVGVKKNGSTDTSATVTAGKMSTASATVNGRTITYDISGITKANRASGKSYSANISVGSGTCGSTATLKVTFTDCWTASALTVV